MQSCSIFNKNAGNLTINSSQNGVEVYLIHPLHERSQKLLGASPLSVPLSKIEKEYYPDKRITLLAKKSGFVSQMINFEAHPGTNHKFELQLEPVNWWIDKKSVEANKIIESVVTEVYKFQQRIKDGRVQEASEISSRLLEAYPSVSHFHHSMGVVKYLQKNFISAEALFKRAIELDGDNSEAKIMLNLTQKKMRQ